MGNLVVSSVEDDTITKIEKPEITPVRFVNPESGMVLERSGYYITIQKQDPNPPKRKQKGAVPVNQGE